MRILLLHSSSDLYGASKIFLQTISILQKKGHECTVVLSSEGPLVEKLAAKNVKVHIINLGILRRKYFTPLGLLNRFKKWTNASKQLQEIINTQNINCVYSNTAAVMVGGWVANKNKIKHIWHIHEIIEKPKFLHLIIKWFMRHWADTIIVVSKAVQQHWGLGVLVYNGIEPIAVSNKINYREQYHIPKEALLIGMAGRIHYWKGQQYFLQIAKALLEITKQHKHVEEQSPLYFIISGDPFPGYEYLLTEMQEFIQENNFDNRVFYIGFENEMDCFYRSIDILLLPSQLPDPLPTVVLEAMQYGLPVIATAQGGALEMVVDNATGIFIPMNDYEKAANKIITILPEAIRKKMGENAKQRVATHFGKHVFEEKITAIFQA